MLKNIKYYGYGVGILNNGKIYIADMFNLKQSSLYNITKIDEIVIPGFHNKIKDFHIPVEYYADKTLIFIDINGSLYKYNVCTSAKPEQIDTNGKAIEKMYSMYSHPHRFVLVTEDGNLIVYSYVINFSHNNISHKNISHKNISHKNISYKYIDCGGKMKNMINILCYNWNILTHHANGEIYIWDSDGRRLMTNIKYMRHIEIYCKYSPYRFNEWFDSHFPHIMIVDNRNKGYILKQQYPYKIMKQIHLGHTNIHIPFSNVFRIKDGQYKFIVTEDFFINIEKEKKYEIKESSVKVPENMKIQYLDGTTTPTENVFRMLLLSTDRKEIKYINEKNKSYSYKCKEGVHIVDYCFGILERYIFVLLSDGSILVNEWKHFMKIKNFKMCLKPNKLLDQCVRYVSKDSKMKNDICQFKTFRELFE